MTQYYIHCNQVEAWSQSLEDTGEHGYAVKQPDGFISWLPKAEFEKSHLPMGFVQPAITEQMVRDFIIGYDVHTIGSKTTVVHATLANGFEIVESSSCVDAANYSEDVGADICRDRIRNRVWHLLGFLLQTAKSGVK